MSSTAVGRLLHCLPDRNAQFEHRDVSTKAIASTASRVVASRRPAVMVMKRPPQIASEVNGLSAPVRWLLDFHAKPLRRTQSPDYTPDPAFVEWHRREVFRSPARAAPGEG